jgi:hypothetical protein
LLALLVQPVLHGRVKPGKGNQRDVAEWQQAGGAACLRAGRSTPVTP